MREKNGERTDTSRQLTCTQKQNESPFSFVPAQGLKESPRMRNEKDSRGETKSFQSSERQKNEGWVSKEHKRIWGRDGERKEKGENGREESKNVQERRGRQTGGFQGPFCSSKAVNTFTMCFPSPSLFTGLCTQRSRKAITQELPKIHFDTEQRCPKRKETA